MPEEFMTSSYRELMEEFSRIAGLDLEHLLCGGSFGVEDIECALMHRADNASDAVHCQIDFGKPPFEHRMEIYELLLQLNYMGIEEYGGSFTVAPDTGHVVYIETLRLAGLTAERLADVLEYCADRARDWRQHHFLSHVSQDKNDPTFAVDPNAYFA
jgi:hypothetical protein